MKTKHKGFRLFLLLWSGQLVSAVGSGLSSFGLSVYVFQTTGRAADVALLALCAFLPGLLLSAPAGLLADRLDRRLLMLLGDGGSALGLLYLLHCLRAPGAALGQLCAGIAFSAAFAALLEPAYRATITELLDRESYTRAGGLTALAGGARYLLSPLLAGLLLSRWDVRLLLGLDIGSFLLTACAALLVRSRMARGGRREREGLAAQLRAGWQAVTGSRGLLHLVLLSALTTLFLGAIQILSEPMLLAFTDSMTLGLAESLCASGMLLSGLLLGLRGIRRGHLRVLRAALFGAGLTMALFGCSERLWLILPAGFGFFFLLPFANACLDHLARVNIPEPLQGRAWGLIGLLSQSGYLAAYALFGLLADALGAATGLGVGRGAGITISASGVLLVLLAAALYRNKGMNDLEQ